jgi:hypothetical protein
MRAVLFQNTDRQKARRLRLLDGFDEVRGGTFFPFDGELRLCARANCDEKCKSSDCCDAIKRQFVSQPRCRRFSLSEFQNVTQDCTGANASKVDKR